MGLMIHMVVRHSPVTMLLSVGVMLAVIGGGVVLAGVLRHCDLRWKGGP